jgi:hypothetical protein
MVSSNQSVFVKKRCIHDNFVLVQSLIKEHHLLEVLQRLGFRLKWRDWISIAFTTSLSRILLNGTTGKPIK